MKRVQFYAATNRSDNLLHIETDGCFINIRVGLSDDKGRMVTSIVISPDDESRGGDREGRVWRFVPGDAGGRVIRQET